MPRFWEYFCTLVNDEKREYTLVEDRVATAIFEVHEFLEFAAKAGKSRIPLFLVLCEHRQDTPF